MPVKGEGSLTYRSIGGLSSSRLPHGSPMSKKLPRQFWRPRTSARRSDNWRLRAPRGASWENIRGFNTPNAKNTLELFQLPGFDPSVYWGFTFTWERQASVRYGGIYDSKTLTSSQAQRELDAWLLVRHRIAHGDTLPSDAERVSGKSTGTPQLLRRNAQRCIAFFEALVMATDASARCDSLALSAETQPAASECAGYS